ncbi:MAG TPA: hypothetical protein PLM75_00275 [bacterium]|nr:hypothetical protein [bacterium]
MFNKKIFLICLITAFILRIILWSYVFKQNKLPGHIDSGEYKLLSEHILQNWNFNQVFGSFRPPLFPLFLASVRLIFNNYHFALFIQNILSLIAIFFIFKLGNILSEKIGHLSLFFGAIHLGLIIFANYILTETLFFAFFYAFTYYFLKFFVGGSNNKRDLIISAILLGLSALVRPIAIYLSYFGFLIVFVFTKQSITKRLINSVVFFAIYFFVISPWLLRNKIVYNHFRFTAQGSAHLIGWVVSEIYRYEKNIDINTAMKEQIEFWEMKKKSLSDNIKNDPFLIEEEVKKYSKSYILSAKPIFIIKAWTNGIIKNIFSPATMELPYIFEMKWTGFHDSPGKTFLEQGYNWLFKNSNKTYSFILLFGFIGVIINRIIQLIGLIYLIKQKHYKFVIINLLIVFYFLMINGPVGMLKYRLPFEPFLLVCSAVGCIELYKLIFKKK